MEQELLRRVQLTLLEIAVEIKRVCEENEPQIRVKALYRAVAIPHYLPENR